MTHHGQAVVGGAYLGGGGARADAEHGVVRRRPRRRLHPPPLRPAAHRRLAPGAGTNLAAYPPQITRLWALWPSSSSALRPLSFLLPVVSSRAAARASAVRQVPGMVAELTAMATSEGKRRGRTGCIYNEGRWHGKISRGEGEIDGSQRGGRKEERIDEALRSAGRQGKRWGRASCWNEKYLESRTFWSGRKSPVRLPLFSAGGPRYFGRSRVGCVAPAPAGLWARLLGLARPWGWNLHSDSPSIQSTM